MKFMEGISILTFIVSVLSGMAIHWVFTLDFPFYVKALCVSLVLLSALLLFINDFEKAMLKK
jgi:hypothetical protein